MAHAFLSSIRVEDVAPKWEDLIVIDANSTVPQALKIFVANNIFCAPVYDAEQQTYIGLVDLLDLITFIIDLEKKGSYLNHDYMDYLEREEEFNTQTTRDVCNLAKKYELCPVPEGTSLFDAMAIMGKKGVPRVPIMSVNQRGEYVGIVSLLTQSAVLQFLSKNINKLGEFSKSLLATGFGPKKVICVEDSKPTLEAFKLIAENRITGLPVLDGEKKLLANISARDLRVIANDPKMFQYLYMSAGDFVSHIRLSDTSFKTVHPSISCTLDENFLRIIARMSAAHIHRIYITDHHRMPVSVVTAHDVINKIASLAG